MAQRDRPFCSAQLGFARGVEALEHFRGLKFGQHLRDGPVELKLTALDLLHCRRGGDGLGHRGDPEHAVDGHGRACRQSALAERALIDCVVLRRRYGYDTGDLAVVRGPTKQLIDA